MTADNFHDFDADRRERSGEPLRFRLGGEEFVAQPTLTVMGLIDLSRGSEGEFSADAVRAFHDFLCQLFDTPDDIARFDAAIARTRLDAVELVGIVKWVIETLIGRPTQRQSGSPDSPQQNGRTSQVASLSPGGPRKKSRR